MKSRAIRILALKATLLVNRVVLLYLAVMKRELAEAYGVPFAYSLILLFSFSAITGARYVISLNKVT